MILIVWQFEVRPGDETDFEKHYGPNGTWVQLFRTSSEFLGTELLRDRESAGRYVTVDRWRSLEAFEAFRKHHAAEYQRIDSDMESLTQSETRLGIFEEL